VGNLGGLICVSTEKAGGVTEESVAGARQSMVGAGALYIVSIQYTLRLPRVTNHLLLYKGILYTSSIREIAAVQHII